jgi:hypothetical protein
MTPERDQEIMDVFLAATELPSDRRASYLDDACKTDKELRAEVESLLRHHHPKTMVATDDRKTQSKSLPRVRRSSSRGGLRRRTRLLKLAVVAIILASCFASLWYATHQTIRDKLRSNVEHQLRTVLNADVAAVEIWLEKQKQTADHWADHPQVRASLSELARLSVDEKMTTSQLEATPQHAAFLQAIGPLLARQEVDFVGVFGRDGHGIAKCPEPRVSDVYWSSRGAALISPCFQGETVFMPTFRQGSNVVGGASEDPQSAAVSVVAPVRGEDGDVVAAMQIVMDIDREFATLLSVARLGETGESFAFDERGVVLNNLSNEEILRNTGLIPEDRNASLHLQLRDPGVDLRTDAQSKDEQATRPLCKVPAIAIANGDAVDTSGYRNYLGARVVGAARWLPHYGFGVATEVDHDEAYAPLQPLTWLFSGAFGLFVCSVIVAALMAMKNYWLGRQMCEERNLGQYTLGELIGEGGMAKVYRAIHARLRRPTAVKLIEGAEAGEEMVARFEREAQLASELTHPNTIQIYDYGQTEEGVFYIAMEYLPGLTLAELISREGPLPASRAVSVLRQVCDSLAEAHSKGLIHRDIKPANIMLCERGGQYDFVKVLDFGLAKNLGPQGLDLTGKQELTGTPLYMAPERICRSHPVGARSDIYALGTVAFYLLTGENLFDGESSTGIIYRVVNEQPRSPSEAVAFDIPEKLDELILCCLAKDPVDRPASIAVVSEVLESVALELPWTQADAKRAWQGDPESPSLAADKASADRTSIASGH